MKIIIIKIYTAALSLQFQHIDLANLDIEADKKPTRFHLLIVILSMIRLPTDAVAGSALELEDHGDHQARMEQAHGHGHDGQESRQEDLLARVAQGHGGPPPPKPVKRW